jgi:2-iminobutanoate/2-iminopropanoate deaminase
MPRDTFASAHAPAAIGPYSQGVRTKLGFIYCSGQTPIDPATGELVAGGITEQTEQVFKNIVAVLAATDKTLNDVFKCNVYLSDMANFGAMNAVYGTKFVAPYPARTTIAVRELPKSCLVEIEVIAE